MATYTVGEIVQARINGKWYDAEILDISTSGAYVYVYDLRIKKNVSNRNIK